MAQVLGYKIKVKTAKSPDIFEDEDITLADLLTQEGVSNVAGDSAVAGALTVTGDADIGGTLGVDGDSTLDGALTVGGALGVTGTSTLHTVSAGVATVTDVVDSSLTGSRVVFTDSNKKLVSLATAGTTCTALTVISSITIVNGIVTDIS